MPERRRDTLPKSMRQTAQGPTAPGQIRRVSRREREARRRRQLVWLLGIAGGIIAVILISASLNQYWFKPRKVLATVDGVDIRRRDYWKVRSLDLVNQREQYARIASQPGIDANQQQQYQALAQQADRSLNDTWGSTGTDSATLERMIEDQLYLQNMDDLGIVINDQDVQNHVAELFAPLNAPLVTPTPSPTLIPARAAWATETAVSLAATEAAALLSPEASPQGSPVSELIASPVAATPAAMASPPANPSVSQPEVASPAPAISGSPEATPVESPTPNQEQARQTAEADYATYRDTVFGLTHMSQGDYERLVARPELARLRVADALQSQIGQTAEQVHAAHILVDTKDLANSIHAQVTQPGASFEEIATNQSNDSGTAANGGDLGWFTRGQMVDQFETVAFATAPDQISEPFQTQFGWHILKVYDHQQDRPMTDAQIASLKQSVVDDWIVTQRAGSRISSDIKPTPTPSLEQFIPPADAPELPTPTPTVVPTLDPVPAASPAG